MDLLPFFQNQMPPQQRSMGEPVVTLEKPGEWSTTIKVCFDTPENMNHNESKYSPSFSCLERIWKLGIVNQQTSDGKYVNHGIFLQLDSGINVPPSINISIIFRVRNSNRDEMGKHLSNVNFEAGTRNGIAKFLKWYELSGYVVKGKLTVEIQMKSNSFNPSLPQTFIPKNPSSVVKRFRDERLSDVVFEVGGQQQTTKTKKKKAKCSPTLFHAHRIILEDNAPTLAELCRLAVNGTKKGEGLVIVPITDVKPNIFHMLLYFVYGGEISVEDMTMYAREIIDAADKYGVSSLKLKAEAFFVHTTKITVENMMEHLLYADAKNCPLLKETVIDFAVENGDDVLDKVSLKDLPPGMYTDLFVSMMRWKKGNGKGGEKKLSTMRVSELREKLNEKGMDVDGSRESMIASLNKNA